MGQKIHPVGLRLNITQSHRSDWYWPIKKFVLLEDKAIRDYLFKVYNRAKISEIFIKRDTVPV
jgi:small subunit ribosomal protein S3